MKRHFILFSFLSIFMTSQGQNDSAHSNTRKYRILYYYTFGLATSWGDTDKCTSDLMIKYGFDYKVKAGCVVRTGQVRRWERHNHKVTRKLVKRHGINWRKKYEAEAEKC